MANDNIRFFLKENTFRDCKDKIASFKQFSVHTFRFSSGIAGLQIENSKGRLIILPFHGQQIWDVNFNGRRLGMSTPVLEPKPTDDFLSNMGAFMFHCGVTAMGSPGPEDTHPLHGELVNALYRKVYLDAGVDEKGAYVGVGGEYEHSAAFGCHYSANPYVRLYEDETILHASMRVKNLNKTAMEYMYLAHINFLPVDNGRFVYSAVPDNAHVRVRENLPESMRPSEEMKKFVRELAEHPEKHHILTPGLPYDPEIVFLIDYEADENGWAHAMQVHPDGSADYVSHRPEQLDTGIRWICRTPDQQALGMEAGTAGPEGYTAEKKKGKVKVLEAGSEFYCQFKAGLLLKKDAQKTDKKINKILAAK